jgi:NADH-quinone oxidoreductase subunit F
MNDVAKFPGIPRIASPADLKAWRERIGATRDPKRTCITVCAGTACRATGAEAVVLAFHDELAKAGLDARVDFRETGCHGFCERGPLVVIKPKGIFYQKVKAADVAEIVARTIATGEVVERLLYTDPVTGAVAVRERDVPFYKAQDRLLFSMNGTVDPTKIEDYIALGGYEALAKALTAMTREKVLDQVRKADLRGRGGGGFPTARKWASVMEAQGEPKYVLCNADEGDPGAYMDRSLLEGNPHLVLEGMLIGAYTIGSSQGYVYVRNEYPLAVHNLAIALDQARKAGFLGENILGTGFSFDVKVNRGGGAFVCGESTALMASIEGMAGEPRAKYVHTAEKGLNQKPTCLNNVETWANVPLIIRKGAAWYSKIGSPGGRGTKIFSLVGKINNTGLVEVPMGVTLRKIVYDVGGGIPGGKAFKAVQTGGPSGGCVPAQYLDMPVDFDSLWEVGSMMGSGGMIVMDENTCMVDVARYFTDFLSKESCGKCTPCREGVFQLRNILTDICEGRGKEGDLEFMTDLGETIKDTALCGLGNTAPNPLITTLRYFKEEYREHIHDKKCRAGVCKALIEYSIDAAKCTACGRCRRACPVEAIAGAKKTPHVIDKAKCIKCGACYEVCQDDAVVRR